MWEIRILIQLGESIKWCDIFRVKFSCALLKLKMCILTDPKVHCQKFYTMHIHSMKTKVYPSLFVVLIA